MSGFIAALASQIAEISYSEEVSRIQKKVQIQLIEALDEDRHWLLSEINQVRKERPSQACSGAAREDRQEKTRRRGRGRSLVRRRGRICLYGRRLHPQKHQGDIQIRFCIAAAVMPPTDR